MLRWTILGLLSSACLASSVAAQEHCYCSNRTFEWRGCGSDGTCDAGAWTGCTPSPDDGYAINAGCRVAIDGEDVLLADESPRRLRVRAGGTLVVRGPARLAIGPIGLVGEPGSRIELNGCFRRFSGDGDACAPTLDADALFPAGRVIPCRDLDCSSDSDRVRLDWSDASGDFAARIDELLARVDAERDAICFWQRREDSSIGSDAGYCYRVLATSAIGGERYLDFDLRQTWQTQSDQAGYPLARRHVFVATLASDAGAGTRALVFEEADLAVGRAGPAGRYLRCPGEPRSHLIATASDEPGGDAVLLADARGLVTPLSAGTVCHVDWGWAQWDSAFVMAPVHVTAHTPTPDRAQLLLDGETLLRGVVVDGLGGASGTPVNAALAVRGGPLLAFEHVWVIDPLVTNTAAVLLDDLPCGAEVRHLTVTGGPSDPAHDKNYGLAWFGGSECAYSLRHLYTRYAGDDNFVLESTGADPVGSIDLRFVQAGPSSDPGDSGQFFDFGTPNPTNVTVRHALCTGCTSRDGRGALVAPTQGDGLVANLLWIGVHNGGLVPASFEAELSKFRFERFGVIGSNVDASNPLGSGPLAGVVADRFYVRDVSDPRSSPNQLCTLGPSGARARSLQRGIFADVSLGSTPCRAGDASLSDLYFVDVTRTDVTGGPLLEVVDSGEDVALSRLTLGYTTSPSGTAAGVLVGSAGAADRLALDGLLLFGFRSASAIRAMQLGAASNAAAVAWEAPTCFWDNDQDEDPAVLAAYGVAPVRGVDPRFADLSRRRLDLALDSPLRATGCGAGEAGYSDLDWAHRKAKVVPMYMGPRPPACGLGVELPLALLAIGRRWLSRGSRAA